MERLTIGVDGGETTGLCWVTSDTNELWHEEVDEWRAVCRRVREIAAERLCDAGELVLEEFRHNARNTTADRWTTKINGALETLAWEVDWECHYQTAAEAKIAVPDACLRAAGFWDGLTDHERDACRHVIRHRATRGDEWARDVLREGL